MDGSPGMVVGFEVCGRYRKKETVKILLTIEFLQQYSRNHPAY